MPALSFDDILKPEEPSDKEISDFTIYKADEDKRLVFGWASVVLTVNGEELEDRQHDIIDPEDLEDAAYEYVLNFRDTGEEHLPGYRKKGKLVESVVLTKEKQKAMGIPEGILPVGWWIGFKIDDEDTWQRVKNGTYKMFSIEGKAQREPVEKAQPTGCGVLVIQDGKILTGTRNDMSGYGQICGPGGHVEEGETPEEAAKREAFEEFGITCNDLQPLGIQDGGDHGTSAVFLCTDYEGTPKTDEEEMTDLQWRTIGELKEAEMFLPFAQSLELLPERKTVAKSFEDVLKFNPYHDSLGRFSGGGSAASFTFQTRDPKKQHWADMAMARLKQQQAQQNQQQKPAAQKPAQQAQTKPAQQQTLADSVANVKYTSSDKLALQARTVNGNAVSSTKSVAADHEQERVAGRDISKTVKVDMSRGAKDPIDQIAEAQGWNKGATVTNDRDVFNKAALQSGRVMMRTVDGYGRTTADQVCNKTMTDGNYSLGGSGGKAYGSGMYVVDTSIKGSSGRSMAHKVAAGQQESGYYGGGQSKQMMATVHPNAKIATPSQAAKMHSDFHNLSPQERARFGYDANAYIASKGYDGAKWHRDSDPSAYTTIFNKSALIFYGGVANPYGH